MNVILISKKKAKYSNLRASQKKERARNSNENQLTFLGWGQWLTFILNPRSWNFVNAAGGPSAGKAPEKRDHPLLAQDGKPAGQSDD
jgi:hypothetical protein